MEIEMLLIVPLAFVCEFIDSSLGMGYGTSLTPILLLMGYEPLQVVPAVLFSEFVSGITAGFVHHRVRNVRFNRSSKDTKVVLALSSCAVIGTIIAVILTIKLPAIVLKSCIGVIVASMGIIILATRKHQIRFSWPRIVVLGAVASFNKGMSGGGYGPLVTGGQMLSGVGVKNAVGITSLSEGITCLVGIITYYLCRSDIDWSLAPWLMVGAVLSVPVAAHTLKRIPENNAKIAIGIVVLTLGALTLGKVYFAA